MEAIDGLVKPGRNLAADIAQRWVKSACCATGKLVEVQRARSVEGTWWYPVQDGFAWTNAVLIKLLTISGARAQTL